MFLVIGVCTWSYPSCKVSGSCTGQGEVWMQSIVPEYQVRGWTPHLLICYKFIWRCDYLQTQGSTEQGSEPQCRPFCHATFSPCFHALNYVNCLCHLNYWNMETHVNTNYSTVTSCLKYPINIYNIAVQELVIRYFCEEDVHFHSSPVVRFYISFWVYYKPIVITIFVCTVSALPV